MLRTLYIVAIFIAATHLTIFAQTGNGDPVTVVKATDTMPSLSMDLDELVITAKKDVVKSDGAKLTYDMSEDDSSKGQSLLEALRKVPMVNVDGQDKITINGSSNFKIYVNGKEDQMLEANYSQVFKAMPSSSVNKIEVITEPGAQYDAEGIGGILNLITDKASKNEGYSGSVSLQYGNRQGSASAYVNAKVNKFSLSTNVAYADQGAMKQESRQYNDITYINDDINHYLVSNTDQKVKFHYVGGGIDMGWEPNSRNLFNWGGSATYVLADIVDYTSHNNMYDRAGNRRYGYTEHFGGTLDNVGATANASYRHSFNDDNTHRLIIAYLFNYGINTLDFTTRSDNGFNYELPNPWRLVNTHNYTREHTVQIDYSVPLHGDKQKLDAGIKGIFRRNTANSKSGNGKEESDIIVDPSQISDVDQNQDIYAAYLSYNGTFGHFGVTAGLRYEHTDMGMVFKKGVQPDFTNRLNDWVPNAALTWNLGAASSLRLAYQMRISRPSLNQVDPYRLEFNQYQIQQGNPDLDSEHSNGISLTYSNFGRILGGNIKLQYSNINNAIVNYDYLENGSIISSYANIGRRQSTELSGFLNINITPKMTLALNGSVSYIDYKAPVSGIANHGWSGNYGVNWSYTGPWDLKFNVNGGQMLHYVMLQGHNDGWYYYGLSVSRDFLKNKTLNVSLSAYNFLQDYMDFKTHTSTSNYISNSNWSNRSWSVALSVSWNFGHLKEKIKSTGLDIDNDDVSRTSGKKGGMSL